ncbi:MAG: alanine--tRNA ligase [Halobacteriales archaeon]
MTDEYHLDYFEENGFHRKECPECDRGFWTRDESREVCGEPPCGEYTFIGDPAFDDEYTVDEMREEFLSYFEDNGHTRIDPYPVDASRWRDDVLLTQASIYDFQPLVTSGETPPPANPLCISQPCIRMQDIDNVGKTGRHTLAFEMMAHHAFNSRAEGGAYEGEVYWKEETVEFCDGLLESLGAPLDEVTYVESPWVGGGNAGPAFEVILRGLELATLVFMDLELDADGEFEMKDGNTYSKMDEYIVDTGYGLERFTWMSQGTPTVYDSIYPDVVGKLLNEVGASRPDDEVLSGIARLAGYMDTDEVDDIEDVRREVAEEVGLGYDELVDAVTPLENAFAIADHSRVLAYMLGDGIVPSNVGTGYLARLVLRRTVRLMDEMGLETSLEDLVDEQARKLGYHDTSVIRDVVSNEVDKYRETMERGRRLVERRAEEFEDVGAVPIDDLIEMYDSHGVQPETVREIAAEHDVDVVVPEDFYSRVAERHESRERDVGPESESDIDAAVENLPDTELLYYEDAGRTEFEASVLEVFDVEDGNVVVLDQTRFYPEGGGQPADRGVLEDGELVQVEDVESRNGVVLHYTDRELRKGDLVRGRVDAERRNALRRAHTATHVVIDAARRVLGDHVRQAGAQKGVESSRIDLTHHRRLTGDEVREIERVANDTVRKNVRVRDDWMDRHEAEDEFGFGLYQGGIPSGEEIRVVQVDEDVQACGGTHVDRTGDLGFVKILRSERIQDGVERLEFAVGDYAVRAAREVEETARSTAEVFGVPVDELSETAGRFFDEWKGRGKEIEVLRDELADLRAEEAEETEISGVSVVVQRLDGEMEELRAAANSFVDDGKVAVLAGRNGDAGVVVGVPDEVDIDAGDVAGRLSRLLGGDGGGSPRFGQGGGPEVEMVDEALEESRRILREEL